MEKEVSYLKVWFEGHVQGVGFRYKTLQIAKEFEVNGKIENLNDKRVYLQIEATESEAYAFKAEIEKQLEFFFRKVEMQASQRTPKFKGFTIS